MLQDHNTSNNITKKSAQPNAILRYSGMATQMMAIILVGVFSGMWLDKHFQTAIPYFTGGLTILGVVLSMVFAVKDMLKQAPTKKEHDEKKPK